MAGFPNTTHASSGLESLGNAMQSSKVGSDQASEDSGGSGGSGSQSDSPSDSPADDEPGAPEKDTATSAATRTACTFGSLGGVVLSALLLLFLEQ